MTTYARMGGNRKQRPGYRETSGLIPILEAMLADCTDPDRCTDLSAAIEDLNAGRVAVLLKVQP